MTLWHVRGLVELIAQYATGDAVVDLPDMVAFALPLLLSPATSLDSIWPLADVDLLLRANLAACPNIAMNACTVERSDAWRWEVCAALVHAEQVADAQVVLRWCCNRHPTRPFGVPAFQLPLTALMMRVILHNSVEAVDFVLHSLWPAINAPCEARKEVWARIGASCCDAAAKRGLVSVFRCVWQLFGPHTRPELEAVLLASCQGAHLGPLTDASTTVCRWLLDHTDSLRCGVLEAAFPAVVGTQVPALIAATRAWVTPGTFKRAFEAACQEGAVTALEALQPSDRLDVHDVAGALRSAVCANRLAVVEFLATQPWRHAHALADVSEIALRCACAQGLTEMVALLLRHGWQLDSKDKPFAGLRLAVENGQHAVVELLLANQAAAGRLPPTEVLVQAWREAFSAQRDIAADPPAETFNQRSIVALRQALSQAGGALALLT